MIQWALLFLTFVLAAAKVEVLTTKNFDSFIAENELTLVEFYAPWCGHCKKLEPEYEKAGKELEGSGAALAKVDATVEKDLGDRFEVRGYPTLKLFRSGKPSAYEGGRSAADIVGYMQKQLGPALKPLNSAEELASFIPDSDSDEPVVVGFAQEGSEIAKFLGEFASKFRDDYQFALVTSAAVAGDNSMDSIVLFKPFDELKNVFPEGKLEEEELTKFLRDNAMKTVDEIGPGNYAAYIKRGLPIAWLFVDPKAAETEKALEEYKKVAPDYKPQISFVHLSGVQYQQMVTKLGLSGKVLPGLAIEKEGQHWVFPETEKFTAENLRPWLEKYVSGELKPTVKSEPVPKSLFDENNVATVVGENFKEVVMDIEKDVLIEFYAPWCGHCKNLVPKWNKLAKALKGVPSIVIAKTDATANDYPAGFQVSGFPTIMLVQSKTNTVVKYSGDREVDTFISWLKTNAATPWQVPAEADTPDQDEL